MVMKSVPSHLSWYKGHHANGTKETHTMMRSTKVVVVLLRLPKSNVPYS